MFNLENIWVAEYCQSQKAFHIDTLDRSLETNLGIILNGFKVDYIPFGIFETSEGANAACDTLRDKMKRQRLCGYMK